MGNNVGRSADWKWIGDLAENTHYTEEEIHQLHQYFLRLKQKQGDDAFGYGISKEQFNELLKLVGFVGTEQFAERLFDVFDRHETDYVDFREFILGLNVFCRGTPEENLKFAFDLYNLEGNEVITKDEMKQILKAMNRTVIESLKYAVDLNIDVPPSPLTEGRLGLSSAQEKEDERTIERFVDKVFEKYDRKKNGLEFPEFVEAMNAHPLLIRYTSAWPEGHIKGEKPK